MSAALPGFVAALTTLPVIGVPLAGSHLSGTDSLHAIVQMPPGVPVATMAIGKAGAKNAGILAAQILGVADPEIEARIDEFKNELAAG
jgi:phosphoribosylaminoimidazole carboxylase PurE protein